MQAWGTVLRLGDGLFSALRKKRQGWHELQAWGTVLRLGNGLFSALRKKRRGCRRSCKFWGRFLAGEWPVFRVAEKAARAESAESASLKDGS
ncbi:hypothetical protein E4K67_00860 [Desulfosporosinus fructosivorans]|uniref:Uncharacterized protein n=1 Tax=Desulfosporosinus fructosivorans TaxID=2018669 RepID=A0A4Z0RB98_9FIRM|nr:hypothetical protein [Desulfosporosinus fructosivorans]TGE39595.1 hypothetical protein E4K67_00860 [Desulfosporosinus fructosivorans]